MTTGCASPVSDGDFKAGIQLVGDAKCAQGGLGCFQNVCRYCKFRETPQSTGFLACTDLGYDFSGAAPATASPPIVTAAPVPPPAPATTPVVNADTGCAFTVSPGDAAVGILLVGDATCVSGGVGCFQNVCRYCKVYDSPQSKHMVPCASLGYPKTVATTVPPTATPPAAIPTTAAPTATPTTAAPTATPTTAAPGTFAPLDIGDEATNCPYPVTQGDYAAGIQLVGDDTCASGGLGCYKNVCRFCKFRSTPQSRHLKSCHDLGYAQYPVVDATLGDTSGCPHDVSVGDAAVGIDLVGDATCASGGLGCFENVCRYCKVRDTPQSQHLLKCSDIATAVWNPTEIQDPTTAPVTMAPPAATTKPVTAAPPATTQPPTTAPAPVSTSTGCVFTASGGDIAVGVQLVGDATCASGGLGCFQNTCRYCKFKETPQSSHWVTCASLGFNFDGSAIAVVTPAPAVPTQAPVATTAAPVPSSDCPFAVSDGDFAVGIRLVPDASCAHGGLGCFQNVCRYCKYKESPQSAHLTKCADYVAPPAALAVKLASTSESSKLDGLFKDQTFQVSLLAAACVGVVAIVALVALGAKRALRRTPRLAIEEVAAEETTSENPKTAKSLLTVATDDTDNASA